MSMEQLAPGSPDLTEQNIERLADLFPGVITEQLDENGTAKRIIDFDLLRQELSDHLIEGPQERYQLEWPGKRQALLTANAPIAKTLRPDRGESVDFETTRNLFIEGDNLEALKLLQQSYLGKVKLIYIDPPYNTGNDFVYSDDFAESNAEYLEKSKQLDEQGNRLKANPESVGRFHSNWLSMIYPRLKLARNLLSPDGVIMISIDDSEAANLRRLCDEVFGPRNFQASLVWQRKQSPQRDATNISTTHDYILVYSRNHPSDRADTTGWLARLLPMADEQLARYKNPDDDPRGAWTSSDLTINKTAAERPNLYYPLTNPHTGEEVWPSERRTWIFEREAMEKLLAEGRVWWGENGRNFPRLKAFLAENQQGVRPQTVLLRTVAGDNQQATRELNDLFPEGPVFDTPKPTKLIKHLAYIANTGDDDIILDFFAGSATTADAVMQLNAEDGAARRFIMVQAPEPYAAGKSPALGFDTIAAAARERIRRAASRLVAGGLPADRSSPLDTGFRAFKVDSTNFSEVIREPDRLFQEGLLAGAENTKEGRSAEDLLFESMLAWGLDPALPVTEEEIAGYPVLSVDDDAILACLEGPVDPDLIRAMALRKPLRALFRDAGFASDADRINAEQIFAEISPATEVKVI